MSVEATGAAAPEATIVRDVDDHPPDNAKPTGLHSPPESHNARTVAGSDSELSDVEEDAVADQIRLEGTTASAQEQVEEEDFGEVFPADWSGTVPVFRPNMTQFKDFKRFMEKVDKYGMKSGIIKIIPPEEWKNSLPRLDDLVKPIRVREPIKQDIMGSNGTYRQVNIVHQRAYNLPQWRQLCEQSEHQPPARRGERRTNADKPKPATRSRAARSGVAARAGKRGRPSTRKSTRGAKMEAVDTDADADADEHDRPMTPVSPQPDTEVDPEALATSVENDPGVKVEECDEEEPPIVRRMGFSRQSKPKVQSTSARRKYIRREGSTVIDEAAFQDWDYQMDVSDYTPERCEELERIYWKTLTYAQPLYGADLPGTLFHEDTKLWNLNKLPNLLDVLGTKVPGVNTAYLYLGMWKATFAWHLEDVDLYSINYLHFGAPKQWYSISQADARRFEAAMKNIWPQEAKACDQFLRHKAFLISPTALKQQFNITVNKCVSYPGEFVVTYPYGYHSGYNLGYNCAEAVNFALDSWLSMGRIAKKCECAQAQDSVWVDVYEIERKLRGESTEYEVTDLEDEEDVTDDESGLPTPPSSTTVRPKGPPRKRRRPLGDKDGTKTKKIRLRLKTHVEPPCCLCPNDIPSAQMLPTDDGRKAHRMCALFIPETYIETVGDQEIVANVGGIDKARLELKCLYCRSKRGACFQCSQKKCARSYHATCAAAAGVFIEDEEVPVFGDDGVEYKEQAFEFSCRFHRLKRDRKLDGDALEQNARIRSAAAALQAGEICQMQYYRGDIFAGVVVEKLTDEEMLVLDIIPNGDRVEVEWKWLLLPDASEYRLPKASPNAIPLPTTRKAQQDLNAKRAVDDIPRKDDVFGEGLTWAEFHQGDEVKNAEQVKVDLFKENQTWFYVGKGSTETKAQYTEDARKPTHNPRSNFLASVPKPRPMAPPPRPTMAATLPPKGTAASKAPKPYVYKPRKPVQVLKGTQFTTLAFAPVPGVSHQAEPQSSPMQPPITHTPQWKSEPGASVFPHVQASSQPGQHGNWHHYQPPQERANKPVKQARPLSFGSDPQQSKGASTSAFKSPERFAPVGGSNGFPQLPGLTWPPAHMNSGQTSQKVSSQSLLPSSTSAGASVPQTYGPPTTSDVASWTTTAPQAGGNTASFQNHGFFQVHGNRDPSRYRTPYSSLGGFTNGFEGNLRAFLDRAQRTLSGGKNVITGIPPSLLRPINPRACAPPQPCQPYSPDATPQNQDQQTPARYSPQSAFRTPWPAVQPQSSSSPVTPSTLNNSAYATKSAMPASACETQQTGSTTLHPAVRPQYSTSWHQNSDAWSANAQWKSALPAPLTASHGSLAASGPRYPEFAKQSNTPIPLPPYATPPVGAKATSGSPASGYATPVLDMGPPAPRPYGAFPPPQQGYPRTSSPLASSTPTRASGAIAPSQPYMPCTPGQQQTTQQGHSLHHNPHPLYHHEEGRSPVDTSFIDNMLMNLRRASQTGP